MSNITKRSVLTVNRRTDVLVCAAAATLAAAIFALVYFAKMAAPVPVRPILINRVAAKELSGALAVDKETAAQLIRYRERLGGFDSTDQILDARPDVAPAPAPVRDPMPGARTANAAKHPGLLDAKLVRPLLGRFLARPPAEARRAFLTDAALMCVSIFALPLLLPLRARRGDAYLLPVTLLLCACGMAMVFSVKDPLRDHLVMTHQFTGIALGMAAMWICARLSSERRKIIARYQYMWVFFAGALVLLLLLFGNGPEGIKRNLFHFQPLEAVNLFLVFFLAAYLGDRADLLTDRSALWTASRAETVRRFALPRLKISLPRLQDLGPVLILFAASLCLFVIVHDLGPALLLFAVFVVMLTLCTGRAAYLRLGVVLMLVGAVIGYSVHLGVFALRVDMWRSPFSNGHANGMQLGQALWAIASGGLEGSGLGLGMTGLIPRGGSDLAFASWCEETGLIGALFLLMLYALLCWRGVRIGLRARTGTDRALAFGLTALLTVQTLIITSGVTGLIPLTGIVLPFFAYGSSALIIDLAAVGLLWSISTDRPQESPVSDSVQPAIRDAGRRFVWLMAALMLGGVGVLRVGYLQAVAADSIATRAITTPDADGAVRPHTNPRLVALQRSIPRGSIYDREGRIVATSRPDEIRKLIHNPNTAERLISAQRRLYPFGARTAQLVGFLDGAVGGPLGLERGRNSELRGYAESEELLADYRSRNLPWPFHRYLRGRDLHLAVDARLQEQAQAILYRAAAAVPDARTGRPKDRAALVLLDAQNGDILVAASTPAFDPNTLTPQHMRNLLASNDARVEAPLMNRAMDGLYPPGSTLKTATAAAALESGLSGFMFDCNRVSPTIRWKAHGTRYVRGAIHDDKGDPAFGRLDLHRAYEVSSNIYFANLAAQVGADTLRTQLTTKLAFRRVPKPAYFDADLPDIGYGQGRMLASPLEMARLVASIANDGVMMRPRLVTEIEDPLRRESPTPVAPHVLSNAMSPQTAATLAEMMRGVVTSGTARGVFDGLPQPVSGKTGTAQNGLADRQPHSWFIGFVPSRDGASRYAFACVVENGGYGVRVAGSACRALLEKLLNPKPAVTATPAPARRRRRTSSAARRPAYTPPAASPSGSVPP